MEKIDKNYAPYKLGDTVFTKVRELPPEKYLADYVDELVKYGGREAIIESVERFPIGILYTLENIPGYWSIDMLEKCPTDFDPTKILWNTKLVK